MILICNRHALSEHRLSSGKWKCKKCEYVYSRRYLMNLKEKAIKYGGGECKKCGYDKCWKALHFHHVNPENKEFAIFEGRPGYKKTRNWEKLKLEINKCILLCANCHMEHHDKDEIKHLDSSVFLNLSRTQIEEFNKSIIKNIKSAEECLKIILEKNKSKKQIKDEKQDLSDIYKDFILKNKNI